jgi:tetratricopeptide (TPR) repeat protein
VLADGIKLLLEIWRRPARAMGEILDRGSALFAILAALAASFLLRTAVPTPFGFLLPVAVLALAYVPFTLLLSALFSRTAVSVVFQRDYSPLLTCAAMAWTAAVLPLTAALWLAPAPALIPVAIAALVYFTLLMFFAARTLFGLGGLAAAAVAALSWLVLPALALFWGPIRHLLGWLASPFLLFYAWYFLGGELSKLGAGLRTRQSFHRMLEAAAVNPHDGDAQYQLGLIHQQRRQTTEAARRFRSAIAIDPEATDAHYQLGRIARAQGRLDEAIAEFETVLRQDPRHSSDEGRRDLGAAYLAAGRVSEARRELDAYADRHAYDPEGLYYLGQALEASGDAQEARELYGRAVEAARTAPRYRRRAIAGWSRLAEKQLRKL